MINDPDHPPDITELEYFGTFERFVNKWAQLWRSWCRTYSDNRINIWQEIQQCECWHFANDTESKSKTFVPAMRIATWLRKAHQFSKKSNNNLRPAAENDKLDWLK